MVLRKCKIFEKNVSAAVLVSLILIWCLIVPCLSFENIFRVQTIIIKLLLDFFQNNNFDQNHLTVILVKKGWSYQSAAIILTENGHFIELFRLFSELLFEAKNFQNFLKLSKFSHHFWENSVMKILNRADARKGYSKRKDA